MIGFDYTDRIAPAALKAAGCSVVCRYTTRLDWGKSLQRPEAEELRAAGIPILCNFESTADRMKGGATAGQADAVEVLQHLAYLGVPAGVTVWFSADWDVQPGEVSAVLAYLQAAAAVLKPKGFGTGLYGGLRAVAAAADAGYGIWQTVAWSGGRWDPRAAARQTGEQRYIGGVQVDVNQIIDLAALGAWGGPTSGDDMQLSDPVTLPPNATAAFPDYGFQGPITVGDLLTWTAVRVSHIANHLGQVDVNALAAALAPRLAAGATADQVAVAVVQHLQLTVSAK